MIVRRIVVTREWAKNATQASDMVTISDGATRQSGHLRPSPADTVTISDGARTQVQAMGDALTFSDSA